MLEVAIDHSLKTIQFSVELHPILVYTTSSVYYDCWPSPTECEHLRLNPKINCNIQIPCTNCLDRYAQCTFVVITYSS